MPALIIQNQALAHTSDGLLTDENGAACCCGPVTPTTLCFLTCAAACGNQTCGVIDCDDPNCSSANWSFGVVCAPLDLFGGVAPPVGAVYRLRVVNQNGQPPAHDIVCARYNAPGPAEDCFLSACGSGDNVFVAVEIIAGPFNECDECCDCTECVRELLRCDTGLPEDPPLYVPWQSLPPWGGCSAPCDVIVHNGTCYTAVECPILKPDGATVITPNCGTCEDDCAAQVCQPEFQNCGDCDAAAASGLCPDSFVIRIAGPPVDGFRYNGDNSEPCCTVDDAEAPCDVPAFFFFPSASPCSYAPTPDCSDTDVTPGDPCDSQFVKCCPPGDPNCDPQCANGDFAEDYGWRLDTFTCQFGLGAQDALCDQYVDADPAADPHWHVNILPHCNQEGFVHPEIAYVKQDTTDPCPQGLYLSCAVIIGAEEPAGQVCRLPFRDGGMTLNVL